MGADGADHEKRSVFGGCNIVATQICIDTSKFGERARSANLFGRSNKLIRHKESNYNYTAEVPLYIQFPILG